MLKIPNTLNAMSSDLRAWGVIKIMQTHTPKAHDRLKSFELFLLAIRTIKGILKNGNATADTIPIFSMVSVIFTFWS